MTTKPHKAEGGKNGVVYNFKFDPYWGSRWRLGSGIAVGRPGLAG